MKPAFLLIAFILLILTSEFIYNYKNKSGNFAFIYLYLAEKDIQKGKLSQSLTNLDKAAELHIRQNKVEYPENIQIPSFDNNLENIDSETSENVENLLKQRLPGLLKNNKNSTVSNIYYTIGVLLYERSYHADANEFFSTAVLLDPSLSFLHVELANSYFNDAEFEKGLQALNYCLTFNEPRKHCQEYIDVNVNQNSYDAVGVLQELIDEHQLR